MRPQRQVLTLTRVYDLYRDYAKAGEVAEKEWNKLFGSYESKHPEQYTTLKRQLEGELPEGWQEKVSNLLAPLTQDDD